MSRIFEFPHNVFLYHRTVVSNKKKIHKSWLECSLRGDMEQGLHFFFHNPFYIPFDIPVTKVFTMHTLLLRHWPLLIKFGASQNGQNKMYVINQDLINHCVIYLGTKKKINNVIINPVLYYTRLFHEFC